MTTKINIDKIKTWHVIAIAVILNLVVQIIFDMMGVAETIFIIWYTMLVLVMVGVLQYIYRVQHKMPAWTRRQWGQYALVMTMIAGVLIIGQLWWR